MAHIVVLEERQSQNARIEEYSEKSISIMIIILLSIERFELYKILAHNDNNQRRRSHDTIIIMISTNEKSENDHIIISYY
jgi:protein involved in polysaccharide export with SLBB domain